MYDADRSFTLAEQPTAEALISLACEILASRHQVGEALTGPAHTKQLLQLRIGNSDRELFHVMLLDCKHRLLHEETLFAGTINSATVHPREIARAALRWNAAACVISHCHPSGDVEPSRADIAITAEIKAALALLDVRLLDHIIVSRTGSLSLAERGLL
ncbi:DNA repair protein RadC (plasmid) [Stenotrophomonas oahuensis]|uniref:DNA repair protein RadC n=1 Tax=Stenotrophomonas oahuensis TaxID=3003271 RepID=A0ABY9YVZ9_9GAMM|nr:DNA repair protein RadC [Stenotrophomonas sp. A5586]